MFTVQNCMFEMFHNLISFKLILVHSAVEPFGEFYIPKSKQNFILQDNVFGCGSLTSTYTYGFVTAPTSTL